MHEPYPAHPNIVPPSREALGEQYEAFERAHTRYEDVTIPPGGKHFIDARGFEEAGDTTVAYLHASAAPGQDVDTLHIEDVRAAPNASGQSKSVYGREVPLETDFLLVNGPQAKYAQQHPGKTPRGFTTISRTGNPTEYGRSSATRHDFADMGSGTSRRHLSIEEPAYGRLLVRDLGSQHGIAIKKRVRTAVDGTPVTQSESYGLTHHELDMIDRGLARVDVARVPQERKQMARELIAQGTYNGASVDYEPVVYSGSDVIKARESLADIALRDPNTAKTLIEKRIVGLHGTRSIALVGVMYAGGMFSAAAMREAGYPVLAGEHTSQYDEGQTDTSFAALSGTQRALQSYAAVHRQEHYTLPQVHEKLQREITEFDTAARQEADPRRQAVYRALIRDRQQVLGSIQKDPGGLYAQMLQRDFAVLIGVRAQAIERQDEKTRGLLRQGETGLAEFRLPTEKGLPLEDTPVVAVPKHYVPWITDWMRHLGHEDVTVVSIEPFVDYQELGAFRHAVAARDNAPR